MNTVSSSALRWLLSLSIVISGAPFSTAIAQETEEIELPSIREGYDKKCTAFFCKKHVTETPVFEEDFSGNITQVGVKRKERINQGVGQAISTGDLNDFTQALQRKIEAEGKDSIAGSVVYITGVDMDDLEVKRQEYLDAISSLGLVEKSQSDGTYDIQLKVISLPKKRIIEDGKFSFKAFANRAKYWGMNIERDYEKPETDEVLTGIFITTLIELGTVHYLFDQLPLIDASLTLLIHTITLVALTVYNKTFVNWMTRPGAGTAETYSKQMAVALLFILNYNIAGELTPIMEYVSSHNFMESAAQFANETGQFLVSDSLNMILQTAFYTFVIIKVVGTWINKQSGDKENRAARVVSQYATLPIKYVDSILLAMASGVGAKALYDFGPLVINWGHVGLVAITGIGVVFYKLTLDATLSAHLKVEPLVKPYVDMFNKYLAKVTRRTRYIKNSTVRACKAAIK